MKCEGAVRTDLGVCKSRMDGNEAADVWAFDRGRKLQPHRLVHLGLGYMGYVAMSCLLVGCSTLVLTDMF